MYPSHVLSGRVRPQRVSILLIGLFLALTWTSPAFSAPVQNNPDNRANTEALTHSLVGLNKAYQKAAPAAKAQALQQLIDATVERQARLAELVETDPGAVLRIAIPDRIRKQMPAEVQGFIEQRLEIEGELEVMYEDYDDGSHRLVHTLKTNGERVALHFKSLPPGLLSGTHAEVGGVLVGDAMAVESGKNDILTLALGGGVAGGTNGGSPEPVPNTFGEQRTLVILVNFQDDPVEPYTPEFARDVIFGETSDFFLENSFGQTWLSGDVTGWHTIPVDSTVCDTVNIRDYAEQAATSAGVDLATYTRYVYAFPKNACGWGGTATVGGNPSRAWLKGDLDLRLTGHELGHNLGLEHSHSLVCDDGSSIGSGSAVSGSSPWPNCSRLEYGDGLDIMGASLSGHFNAFQKERLGWLGYGSSPAISTVEISGSYELAPYAAQGGSTPKALKIFKAEDQYGLRTWYYLEYRQAIGFDSIITDYYSDMDASNVLNGTTVHAYWEGGGGYGGYLLDMTTETNLDPYTRDPALVAGETFLDPDGMTTITTNWTDASGAMVSVSLAPPVCVTSNPTLSLSPPESQWVEPGTAVTYTATLSNRDSISCAAAMFDLAASIPVGWTVSLADSALTLEPGASDTTTVIVTSSVVASDGFYDVTVSAEKAANRTYTATATATYVVNTPVMNQSPNATNDSAETPQDTEVLIDVLANDSDPDHDILLLEAVTQGNNGSVVINPDKSLKYMPNVGYSGADNFTYTVADGNGGSATASVSVTVIADTSNQPPIALNDAITIQDKNPVTINVLANDVDPDGDVLSVTTVTNGAKGAVTINADNTITYSPAKSFKSGDSFTYVITDGAASATATVTITLQSGGGGGKGRKPKE